MASPNLGTQQEHPISPPPQEGHLIPPRTSYPRGTGLQVLSSTEGIDFRTYLDSLYFSIRRNLLATIPESAAIGEKGIVVVRFQIQKDGTLPDKSATIVSSSGKKDMDAVAFSAIRTAAPFARLPEGYAEANLWSAKIRFSGFQRNVTMLHCVEILGNHGRNNNSPATGAAADVLLVDTMLPLGSPADSGRKSRT